MIGPAGTTGDGTRDQFHKTLIRLNFNPMYFMENYTYFKQFNQECLKQNI